MPTIFVSGATGTIGGATVKALRQQQSGVTIRAGVRDRKKAEALSGPNVTLVEFDYQRPDTWAPAFRGADAAFLMTPPASGQATVGKASIDAAKAAGIKRVVRLSVLVADQEPGIALSRDHRLVDQHLRASGLEWTILRPNSFMQNFIEYSPPQPDGNIYLPFGNGACSYVDALDVGTAAARALSSSGYAGKAYDLTGVEALTVAQCADAMAQATGRSIKYVDIPPESAKRAMLEHGVPEVYADALLELYAIIKAGNTAAISADTPTILGRPPRRFHDFVSENAGAWSV